MKALTIIQMFFGALAGVDSCYLVRHKAVKLLSGPAPGGGFWLDSRPPDTVFEYVLLACGVLILVGAFFQARHRFRFFGWQMLLSSLITIGGAYLSIRAATMKHGEASLWFYLVYGFLVLGVAVVVVGLFQLIKKNQCLSEKQLSQ